MLVPLLNNPYPISKFYKNYNTKVLRIEDELACKNVNEFR